jgi:hypothetical protein
MRVAVGCPIRNRAWVFPEWLEHVRIAFDLAGLKPIWVFAIGVDPSGTDDGTQRLVTDLYRDEPGMWSEDVEPPLTPGRIQWNNARYEQMVTYRNKLLNMVQIVKPDYFLSLDSDILLHPSGLVCLLDTIEKKARVQGVDLYYDAVGGKAFLGEGSPDITTYGSLGPNGGGLRRKNADGVFPVENIMALKLMNPEAYKTPYKYSQWGEDIGWSENCRAAGLHLGWDGRVCSKHVMRPERLQKVDSRVGW